MLHRQGNRSVLVKLEQLFGLSWIRRYDLLGCPGKAPQHAARPDFELLLGISSEASALTDLLRAHCGVQQHVRTVKADGSIDDGFIRGDGDDKNSYEGTSVLRLASSPRHLLVTIKRTGFEGGAALKSRSRLTLPETIALDAAVSSASGKLPSKAFACGKASVHDYRLKSVIVHLGRNQHSGHYIVFIRQNDSW